MGTYVLAGRPRRRPGPPRIRIQARRRADHLPQPRERVLRAPAAAVRPVLVRADEVVLRYVRRGARLRGEGRRHAQAGGRGGLAALRVRKVAGADGGLVAGFLCGRGRGRVWERGAGRAGRCGARELAGGMDEHAALSVHVRDPAVRRDVDGGVRWRRRGVVDGDRANLVVAWMADSAWIGDGNGVGRGWWSRGGRVCCCGAN